MKKLFLTALTATALALSPMASAPAAAADTKDVLGVLLGIAALGAIANQLDDDQPATRQNQRVSRGNVYRNDDRYRGHNRRSARVLPGQCLRVADTRGRDDRIVFPEVCLNNNGVRTHDLPRRCESRINTNRGRMDVYGARCLADAGWSLPRIASRRY